MKIMLRICVFWFAMLFVLNSNASYSPDQCRDVLKDGAFQQFTAIGKRQLTTAAYSKLVANMDVTNDSTTVLGLNIPIEGVPVGVEHSKTKLQVMRSALSHQSFSFLNDYSEWAYAQSSGDEKILEAWTTCIGRAGGGVVGWFEVQDSMTLLSEDPIYSTKGCAETRPIRETDARRKCP